MPTGLKLIPALLLPLLAGPIAAQPAPVAIRSNHWSFQPIRHPQPPAVRDNRWPANPIDAFVLAKLEAAGRKPAAAADKHTWLRRATFDLTGLPPTPEECDAFERDRSGQAFARVVDRLLASPRYGERWGRFWLDLARYADTSGDSADYPIPQAHRYRDYVIRSFNQDKPYDQFLREQIAGDLLPADSPEEHNEAIIATGYVALSRRFGVNPGAATHLTLEDTIDTLGRTVLGLSMSCARCHDHKHDPITMQDYYGLYGIFASTRYPSPGSEEQQYQTNFVVLRTSSDLEARAAARRSELTAIDDEIARLEKRIDRLEREGLKTADLQVAYDAAWDRKEAIEATLAAVPSACALAEAKPMDAQVQKRGEPWAPGETVPRRFLKILGGRRLAIPGAGSGRLDLASWLVDPDNPLTARVWVNRLWQHHFGRGLVPTPSDFGTRGQPPSHPELLDYLATRFVQEGWSAKAMHRMILLSAAYRQASVTDAAQGRPAGADDRDLIRRFRVRRLEAEEIRDALLVVSGALDLTSGGPHPFPPPEKWKYTQHRPFEAVYESRKRSVYLMQQRIKRHPFLALFDGADSNTTTAERGTTLTPLQALFAMNDPFVHESARRFAGRLLAEAGGERSRIVLAHRLAFGRRATAIEIREGRRYLAEFRAKLRAARVSAPGREEQAWSSYARALLGSNEFLFID